MESTNAINDLLSSGGPPTFKFEAIGDTISGVILKVERTQQTDFQTGELKFFSNGDPMWQYVFHLQTDLRDPAIPDDDGVRRVFAKNNGFKAARAAISDHRPTPEQVIGGRFAMRHTAVGTPPKPGLNPPKLFEAEFQPNPNPGGSMSDLLGTPAATPAPAPQPATPAGSIL